MLAEYSHVTIGRLSTLFFADFGILTLHTASYILIVIFAHLVLCSFWIGLIDLDCIYPPTLESPETLSPHSYAALLLGMTNLLAIFFPLSFWQVPSNASCRICKHDRIAAIFISFPQSTKFPMFLKNQKPRTQDIIKHTGLFSAKCEGQTYAISKRSRFITFAHAATKSRTNFSLESEQA